MPKPSAPTVLDSRRVSRRRFLRAAAGGAAGLAGVLATGRPPAIAQTRELTFLTFASFVPDTDKELKRQFEEWGAQNKVKVRHHRRPAVPDEEGGRGPGALGARPHRARRRAR